MSFLTPPTSWKSGIFECFNSEAPPGRYLTILLTCLPCTYSFVIAALASRIRTYPLTWGFTIFLVMMTCVVYISYTLDILLDINAQQTKLWEWYVTLILGTISFFCGVLVVYTIFILRVTIRQKLRIAGDTGMDVLASVFCSCCTVVQMANEVDLEEGGSILKCTESKEYQTPPGIASKEVSQNS